MNPRYLLYVLVLLALHVPGRAQIITTYAGNGTYGYSGNGGPATSAQLAWPIGVVTDHAGNVYISDVDNNVICKVDPSGIISTYAGTGALGFTGDGGPAINARLYHPDRMAFDAAGNFYFADQNGDVLRKITPAGIVTTISSTLLPGYSGDGGPFTSARISGISGIAFDNNGNMFLADFGNNVIRKVDAAGIITTYAGTGVAGYSGDGGPAAAARFGRPQGVIFYNGELYIPDTDNQRIRKISAAGIVTTFAGNGTIGYSGDGGPALSAQFRYPWFSAFDASGNFYISDGLNSVIRKIDPSGIITTFAGNGTWGYSGDGGPATAAQMDDICGVTADDAGNVYVINRGQPNVLRKITNCLTAAILSQPQNRSLCTSGNTSFSVTATGAASYQWQVNTGSSWTNITDNALYSGSGTATLTLTNAGVAQNNYRYRCALQNTCAAVFTVPATLTVAAPVTPAVSVAASATIICAGTSVSFTATPVNGGAAPAYQWKKNGGNVGTNSATYTDNALIDGDVITCRLTSSQACTSINTVDANPVTITVRPTVTPAVSIAASTNTACSGTAISFTATPANEGASPAYQWLKNGQPVGSGQSSYSDNSLQPGDQVSCRLTSSAGCVTTPVATSNVIAPAIQPLVTPTITISASPTAICPGTPVTFTAAATNAGASPAYQWRKNGQPVGAGMPTYSDNQVTPTDGISCVLTSNAACLAAPQATSNMLSLTVYTPPTVSLDQTPTLCAGSTRVLDAGNFTSYAWNDGSTGRTLTVSGTGTYSVTVTDAHGCTAGGSTVIGALLPVPSHFLPEDTAICSYGTLVLQPLHAYPSYVWSTGAGSSSVTIAQPGLYWLQVRDGNGCSGRDTVLVAQKQCMKGLYVPSAFTPNGDGRNDTFRALIFGDVKLFEFTVYNRWGQVVFQTRDVTKSWDGSVKGQGQDTGAFVWLCRYRLDGEDEKVERGNVVLIR